MNITTKYYGKNMLPYFSLNIIVHLQQATMFALSVNNRDVHVIRECAEKVFGDQVYGCLKFNTDDYEPDFTTIVKTISGLIYDNDSNYIRESCKENPQYHEALMGLLKNHAKKEYYVCRR